MWRCLAGSWGADGLGATHRMVMGNEAGIPGCRGESKGPAYHISSCALGKISWLVKSLSFAICKMGVMNVTGLRRMNNY